MQLCLTANTEKSVTAIKMGFLHSKAHASQACQLADEDLPDKDLAGGGTDSAEEQAK